MWESRRGGGTETADSAPAGGESVHFGLEESFAKTWNIGRWLVALVRSEASASDFFDSR